MAGPDPEAEQQWNQPCLSAYSERGDGTGVLGPEEGKRHVGQAAGEEMLPWGGVGEDVSISLFLSFAKGMPNTMAG